MRAILLALVLVLSLGLIGGGVNQAYAESSEDPGDSGKGLDNLRERGGNPADFPIDEICEHNPNCDDQGVGVEPRLRNIEDGLDPCYPDC